MIEYFLLRPLAHTAIFVTIVLIMWAFNIVITTTAALLGINQQAKDTETGETP